ncbi:MAG TPA: hypothetical protein VIV40_31390 [Kofleriaceae bacterium]
MDCCAQRRDALHRIGMELRRGCEHRTVRDVCGRKLCGSAHLFEIVRRDSDREPRTDEQARVAEWDIGLPEVHTVGADRERDVDPIVDDQLRAGFASHAASHSRDPDDVIDGRWFQANLQHASAGADERARELFIVAIEDGVETFPQSRPDGEHTLHRRVLAHLPVKL